MKKPLVVHQSNNSSEAFDAMTELAKVAYNKPTKGLINKYVISKSDGSPIDEGAEYFVLRLDKGQNDKNHLKACLLAVNEYANNIESSIPNLARDIRLKWPDFNMQNYAEVIRLIEQKKRQDD